MWPEFTFWHLLAGVFYYQRHYQTMSNVKRSLTLFPSILGDELKNFQPTRRSLNVIDGDTTSKSGQFSQRAIEFLDKFDKRKHNQLVELSAIGTGLRTQPMTKSVVR